MDIENDLYAIQNFQNYYIIDEEKFDYIINNINYNYLLILFTMTCVCSLISSINKSNDGYLRIQNAQPVQAEIINKV
jgi:hypothetical protein